MLDILSSAYLWIKALHIMAVIAWMAGLFYLPRLFVYHAERATPSSELSETLKVMEHKLLVFIMRPAMIVAWACGLLMIATPGIFDWGSVWAYAKLVGVVAMTGFHIWLKRQVAVFAEDGNTRSGKFFRAMNEVPTLLMLIIVVMVVVKPF
ncbi:MAG: protoporphyrinogen oxidase HemJ [Pseudomonadota bacterium]